MRALRKTFLNGNQVTQLDAAHALAEFARQGVLIIDSLPFSMKYSSGHRAKPQYRELVAKSVRTYLGRKLEWPGLSWSRDVRVALAFRLNAVAVIAALDPKQAFPPVDNRSFLGVALGGGSARSGSVTGKASERLGDVLCCVSEDLFG
jgi:hypothetical protein